MLAPNPAVNELPAEAPAPRYHDVTVVTKRTYACAKVEGVPPEEFGIARNARSIRDCDYCFHEVLRSEHALIADGFDAKQIKDLPSYTALTNSESQARNTVDESNSANGDDGINRNNRLLKITEHYVRMDYEDNGKPCLYRVTTAGDQGDILKRDGEPDIVQVDMIPFAAMTPVIVTHRFFGRSIADLVMDIQRIKTALLRGGLDNLYLHVNPRVEVSEVHASENTLDDLLVSRPGGIVRTKTPGGLVWQEVPDITGAVWPAMQYFDATREWRTGVSRQGQGLDAEALQNQTATAAQQLYNAAQARMKLVARIFAETGIRDLFALLHATIRKNGSQVETVKLKNKWVPVNPREWKRRDDMTINVGLGTGGTQEQLAGAQLIIGAQTQAIAAGMVSKKNLFNSAKMLCKILKHKDPEEFFTSPDAQPDPNDPSAAPIQPPESPDIQKAKLEQETEMAKLEKQKQVEAAQAQSAIAIDQQKTAAEIARDDRKAAQDAQQSEREHQMKMAELQLRLIAQVANHAAKPQPGAVMAGEDGSPVQSQQPGMSIDDLVARIAPLMSAPQSAPKPRGMRIVRDEMGRVSHTEPM